MRRFECGVCGSAISFTSSECETCGTALGFLVPAGAVVPLKEAGGATFTMSPASIADDQPPLLWRCLNFAWGCNWMLPADAGDVWCESCRLTRGRPDETSIDAVLAWSGAEQAKRRLIYQLRTLGLPVGRPSNGNDEGVVFDLVYLPESEGVTGHRPGVVTLDLREVDDRFRESTRVSLGEADRTVIGHLRHEIGHHYWALLVGRAGAEEEFRQLFGDERSDYQSALRDHYEHPGRVVDDDHISLYATAHPSEDWAETFAHYLHMRDGLESAAAFGLIADDVPTASTESMVAEWQQLTRAVNEIAVGLGHARPYPFEITSEVTAKLDFVHRQVQRVAPT
jgi:hypothetical protein